MSIKRYVRFKQLYLLPVLALLSMLFFSSCQTVSTSTTNVGDWALSSEYSGAPRTQAASFIIKTGGKDVIYIGGGYDGYTNTRLNDWYKFDETNGTWYQVADFPGTPRNLAVGFSVNGKGYVVGGNGGPSDPYLSDVWEYDPALGSIGADGNPVGQWTLKPHPFGGGARYSAVAFAIGDSGYVATGIDSNSNWRKDLWVYAPASDTWTQGTDLGGGSNSTSGTNNIGNDKRQDAVSFVYTNPTTNVQTAYVVTGINNGSYVDDLLSYDAATGLWTAHRKIDDTNDSSYDAAYGNNIQRSSASIFLINDTAYLTCGSYNGVIGTTWCYDIGNDLWFQKTSFEGAPRQGAIGFSINNHGYITTGSSGNNYYDDLWQFYPDAGQTNNDN
ncbi:MAG: kelch repeat-containing protein [Ferruginibacter sp.]